MKRLLLIVFCFLSVSDRISAQYLFPVKEHYDKIYPTYGSPNVDYTDCTLTGNGLSWTLSGLLRMYQATGDKAYLVKFMNHCIQLQKNRRDERTSGDPALWVRPGDCAGNDINSEPLYFNSLLIFPMAEFVNMVIHDPSLYNTTLPIQPYISQDVIDMNTLHQMEPISIIDYGHFALWLGYRVEQTLSYMNANFWDDSYGIRGHNADIHNNGTGIYGGGMNWESPYGCALLYMGLTYTDFGFDALRNLYLSKAQKIAGFYKDFVSFTNLCTGTHFYSGYVLTLRTDNNSYVWFDKSLSIKKDNCLINQLQPNIDWYTEFVEDVAHGAMDLWFVRACYETQFAPDNSAPPYFNHGDMERFRNTFSENIYYTNSTGAHFHNNVDGTNNPNSEACSPNCPTDFNYGEALDWMPLYQFDGNGPSVYDILMQHVTGLLNTLSTSNLTGAEPFLGLSEVVKAQWATDCVNLSLYKRDVVYDQDFNVRNILTIEPEESQSTLNTTNSFADPVIQTNTFTIESGVTSNMTAGEEIILR